MTTVHDSSTGVGLKQLARKIIRQAIRDLISDGHHQNLGAQQYIRSELFPLHLKCAEYPHELRDTLDELVLRSKAARKKLGNEVLDLLKLSWDD